jgi:hypothetical protein
MQTLKEWAIACVGAIAMGGLGAGVATAADIPLQPYEAAPAPQYAPPPAAVYPRPPVVYGYAPPPVVYYDAPPVLVVPSPAYPRRFVYGYRPYYSGYYGYRGYAGYRGYHGGYGPYVARGYGYRSGGHWRR